MFEQNLSPLSPTIEMGLARLQSVVVLLASKKVAYLGQASSKNVEVILGQIRRRNTKVEVQRPAGFLFFL